MFTACDYNRETKNKKKKKYENIKQKQQQTQKQHKKSSRISLPTHPIFPMDFSHAVYLLFQRLKDMFFTHSSRLLRLL